MRTSKAWEKIKQIRSPWQNWTSKKIASVTGVKESTIRAALRVAIAKNENGALQWKENKHQRKIKAKIVNVENVGNVSLTPSELRILPELKKIKSVHLYGERALSQMFGVSVSTIHVLMNKLAKKGIPEAVRWRNFKKANRTLPNLSVLASKKPIYLSTEQIRVLQNLPKDYSFRSSRELAKANNVSMPTVIRLFGKLAEADYPGAKEWIDSAGIRQRWKSPRNKRKLNELFVPVKPEKTQRKKHAIKNPQTGLATLQMQREAVAQSSLPFSQKVQELGKIDRKITKLKFQN